MNFEYGKNRIFARNAQGKIVAQVTFPDAEDGVAEINHTFVDESLRGQGVAGELLEAVVGELRRAGKQARPTCSYAVRWFEKHPEAAGLLADGK